MHKLNKINYYYNNTYFKFVFRLTLINSQNIFITVASNFFTETGTV